MIADKLKIIQDILGKGELHGQEYLFNCPLHEHHKPKLSINLTKNVAKCWICGRAWPALRLLIKQFGNRDQILKWNKINEIVDLSDLLYKDKVKESVPIVLPEEFKSLVSKNRCKGSIRAIEYLKEKRQISEETIFKYRLGFCSTGEYKYRVIIPSFNGNGKLDYYVGRSYEKGQQKYKNPANEHGLIFNELFLDWSKPIILTEGPFDAIAHDNCIPLLGSTLDETSILFRKTIEYCDDITLALDIDALSKQKKIAGLYKQYGITVYQIDTSGYEDIAVMSKDIFNQRFEQRTEYNYNSEFIERLKRL